MSRELKPLRLVLQQSVAAARLPVRTVEQALGLSNGGWDQLLAGQRLLRVRHLLALARLLQVPPADFLEIGLPEASCAAEFRLSDWLESAKPRPRIQAAEPGADWQARIAEAVRRELERSSG
jgi:transcriptional regulator with XRE-family HTH domain